MMDKIANIFLYICATLIYLTCFCFAAWLLVMMIQGLIVVL